MNINTTDQIPFWEANSISADQETTPFLWNLTQQRAAGFYQVAEENTPHLYPVHDFFKVSFNINLTSMVASHVEFSLQIYRLKFYKRVSSPILAT
jgi:hypothetical protein